VPVPAANAPVLQADRAAVHRAGLDAAHFQFWRQGHIECQGVALRHVEQHERGQRRGFGP